MEINEFLKSFNDFLKHIDIVVLVLVIVAGLFAKSFLSELIFSMAIKTLLTGTVFVAAYIAAQIAAGVWDRSVLPDYLITYCVATSMYEILLRYGLEFLRRKFGDEKKSQWQ